MVLQAPQLTYLAIVCIGLGIGITQHGQVKTEKKNAWNIIIGTALQMAIMYCGGFFG